jgi:hypothetical protein
MTNPASQPSEEEVRDFLARLDKFHESLPDNQKAMLEDLTGVALSRPAAEVEGFTAIEIPTFIAFISVLIPRQGEQPPGNRPAVPGNEWLSRSVTKMG